MGKIKNWSKTGKDYWRNNKTNSLLQLGIHQGTGRNIVMLFPDKKDSKQLGWFRNEESARKFAINYMRSHPNG